jgi:DNA-binding NtrC family response regulator
MSTRRELNGIRVLLVDDDDTWLKVLTRLVAADESVVATSTATTLTQTREALASFAPTVIVTDLRLSADDSRDLGGVEVCRDALTLSPPVEVIVLSGMGSVDTLCELRENCVFDFLDKAVVTPEGILASIHQAHVSVMRRRSAPK